MAIYQYPPAPRPRPLQLVNVDDLIQQLINLRTQFEDTDIPITELELTASHMLFDVCTCLSNLGVLDAHARVFGSGYEIDLPNLHG